MVYLTNKNTLKIFSSILFLFFIIPLNAKETFDLGKHIKGMFIGEDLDPKYGNYQDIVLPATFFSGDQKYTNMKKQAVEKVLYRFVKKKSTLSKYPNKAIEGMVWLEVLYNEMIKHPKSIQPDTIKDIWQAREDIRKSMGFHVLESTQEVINRYVLLVRLLEDAKVTQQKIDPNLKKHKKIYKNLKTNISKAKKNYLNTLDENELASLEKQSLKNIDTSLSTTTSSSESSKTLDDSQLSNDTQQIEKKLIDLKKLHETGLISDEVYVTKQQELLDLM